MPAAVGARHAAAQYLKVGQQGLIADVTMR